MTTTSEAPETWRVECEGGETREAEVWGDAQGWCAWTQHGPACGPLPSPYEVVTRLAAREGWPVVAVLAPGQRTRAEVEARLAVAQAIILGGHHADDCPARAHEECAYGGYDPDAALDDCDAGLAPAECAAARGACDCGVLRAVRAVECATPEALRDGAARAAEAAEAAANRDRAWRYVHEARAERDALRSLLAAAARGEVSRCPTCAVRLATRETIRGELHRWCDECDASRVRRFPDEEGNRRDTLHAAALRAAMGGAK